MESGNNAKRKKGRNDNQKSKIIYGRSWSRDLICIFFYMELHNFLDSLFCSRLDAIGLNPQDIDHPSTFEES